MNLRTKLTSYFVPVVVSYQEMIKYNGNVFEAGKYITKKESENKSHIRIYLDKGKYYMQPIFIKEVDDE